ncbi:hypothetical protein RHGRI_028367 [Rhododendron griersonianum]|uniref:Uncharacterized protein n=1 Tax=Rhododendron griersonianum TaxID=479676 RepID=A0AAV6IHY9_9ERIC|nr:hypothetical protein RHGRI_028367 [Rhododendron griersonianum]
MVAYMLGTGDPAGRELCRSCSSDPKRRRFGAQGGKPIKAQNDAVLALQNSKPFFSKKTRWSFQSREAINTMKLSRDGLLSPPSTSATCGSGEKPTDATIHACRPTKSLNAIRAVLESLEDQLEFFHVSEAGVVWKWPGLRQRSLLLEGVRMGSDATHIRVSSTFFIPSYCIPVTMPAEFEKVTVTRPLDITITQYTKSEDTDDVALVDMNCEDFKEATPSRLDIEATSKEMVLMKH